MLKNCSIESSIQKGLFLNFDEDGMINISILNKTHIILSVEKWVEFCNYSEESKTEEQLMMEHFGASYE